MKALLAWTVKDAVSPLQAAALIHEFAYAGSKGVVFELTLLQESPSNWQESLVLTKAMKEGYDVAVLLGPNIEFEAGLLTKMAKTALTRQRPLSPVVPLDTPGQGVQTVADYEAAQPSQASQIVPASILSMDMLVIPAKNLKKLVNGPDVRVASIENARPPKRFCPPLGESYYGFCEPDVLDSPEGKVMASGSSAFSLRLKAAGIDMGCVMGPLVVKHGSYGYTPQDGVPTSAKEE